MRAITLSQVLQLLEERQAGVVTVDRLAVYHHRGLRELRYTAVFSGVIAFPLLPATWVMKRRNFNVAIYANSSATVNRWRSNSRSGQLMCYKARTSSRATNIDGGIHE
jgi:hypothetical protein